MTLIQTIIIVIASITFVKGILVCAIPQQFISIAKPYMKNTRAMRKAGYIGIVIALILFIIATFL